MDWQFMTLLSISLIVSTNGQEYACTFVSESLCTTKYYEESGSLGTGADEYNCLPDPECDDKECSSYVLSFTSWYKMPNVTLHITYITKEGNERKILDIESQDTYQTTFDIVSSGYKIEFQCLNNAVNDQINVSIGNIQVKCQTECDGKSLAGLYVFIPIIIILIAVAIVLYIRRKKRIEDQKKFDKENPQYQSLKRNRTSQHYQFPSLWQKRNKRNPSSASDVYEVCGKVVGNQSVQDKETNDYDYAYARSNAAGKGFEDSAGYLKPGQVTAELDDESYLKPSPSTSKQNGRTTIDTDERGYVKHCPPSTKASVHLKDSRTVDSDDSEYEYVSPNEAVHNRLPPKRNLTEEDKKRNRKSDPKGKPVIAKKPTLQAVTWDSSSSVDSLPIPKRPQPSPRTRKRESGSTNSDYLSIVGGLDIPTNQASIRK